MAQRWSARSRPGGGEAEFVRADLVSPDEIAIKVSIGKLTLRRSLATFAAAVIEAGFETLDVTMRHAAAVAEVPLPWLLLPEWALSMGCQRETAVG